MKLAIGVNVKKLYLYIPDKGAIFVSGKPFWPSPMFTSKAGAYLSDREASFRCSTLG
jgi:hypothetical protein